MESSNSSVLKKVCIFFIVVLVLIMIRQQCIAIMPTQSSDDSINFQTELSNAEKVNNSIVDEKDRSIDNPIPIKEKESNDVDEECIEYDVIKLCEEDKIWLAKTVYAESGICCLDEQIAVCKTIVNRMQQSNMTIYDVITAENQFSSVINGDVYLVTNSGNILVTEGMISDRTWEAVETVLSGEQTLIEKLLIEEAIRLGLDVEEYAEGGPMFFVNVDAVKNKEYYYKLTCKVKIGYQTFYRVEY